MTANVLSTSYINLQDLDEIVKLFFTGNLDDVDKYLPNLYKDLSELHPNNSLFGQLCSDDIKLCLSKLNILDVAALEYFYTKSKKSNNLLYDFYIRTEGYSSYEYWVEEKYLDALFLLADEILDLIND